MPTAASSVPITWADSSAAALDRDAPSAMLPGIAVAGATSRKTTAPPSWSVEMSNGTRDRCRTAAACNPLDRVAI